MEYSVDFVIVIKIKFAFSEKNKQYVEKENLICHNNIALYKCLFCSYIFINRESKLFNY